MAGIVRTACLCILCLAGFCIATPTVEAKVREERGAVRPKSKTVVKQSPRKGQGRKIKKVEGKTATVKQARQRSHTQRRVAVKKRTGRKSEEKRASLQRRQRNLDLPRIPITERLGPPEMPEEILSAELAEEALPLEEAALRLVGTRYRFGGSSIKGLDCSAFVQRVYSDLNISLPRTAREQFGIGTEIPPDEVRKGDLVFFQTYARYPSHVAIYLGDNRMIHASSAKRRVVISNMDTPYYRSRFLGARRLPGTDGEPLPQQLAGL
jgi:cell wall-associated NlpC family hydrolase